MASADTREVRAFMTVFGLSSWRLFRRRESGLRRTSFAVRSTTLRRMPDALPKPYRDLIEQARDRSVGGQHTSIGVLARSRLYCLERAGAENHRGVQVHKLHPSRDPDATGLLEKLLLHEKSIRIQTIISRD